ncbi:hypothetical protein R1flu_026180 [Riccia fluitans]|uniref:Protein kinase domain-containing protein n=1 Tax=Riccia fluitans TaxID=41844 RepID=A0ABD1XF90_9MARC
MKESSSPMVVARSKFHQMALGALQLGLMMAASASIAIANSAPVPSSDLECAVTGTTPSDGIAFDEQILLQFKSVLSDPGDVLGNWDQKFSSVCNWTGVTCNVTGQSNRVSELSLPSLGLRGPLTETLGCLEFLKAINILDNSFYGSIPSGLFRKGCSLTTARFGLNNFSGLLPDTIGNCPAISVLQVNGNSLSGIVPEALTNLTSLSVLDLSSNQFVGQIPHIPSHAGGCSFLESLNLSNNQFQGSIPDSLKDCTSIFSFDMSVNALTGSVPSWLLNLRKLSRLNLGHNKLDGDFPDELFGLTKLGEVRLDHNLLNGTLPDRFNEFFLLDLLDLSNNVLSGEIPRSLGSCKSLIELSLSNNKFTGPIPVELGNLTSFQKTLNLSHNLLQSSIPASLGFLSSVEQIDLSANNLTGNIPPSLGNCTNLRFLDLSDNHLAGHFPSSLCDLRLLFILHISGNELTGVSPNDPCHRLAFLFIKGKAISAKTIIAVTAGVAFFIAVTLIYRPWPKKSPDAQVQELAAWNGPDLEVIRLTVEDLLKATDNFCRESIIGFGSSGTVHKGVLQIFPFVIAVKKFMDDEEGRKRLSREARIMKLIRHRNLVQSLGARTSSSDLGSQAPGLNVLVLEYMPNGTLDNLLYGTPLQDFSLEMRVNVAVDVVTGLCYLHGDIANRVQIIHGDIKPGNIFLKSGFVASIGDFGLSQLALNGRTRDHSSNCHWEGTFGYCPPELGQGYMSTAGDVYGLGVTILEMLVRRRPTSFTVEDTGFTFVPWIRNSFPHELNDIIDPALMSELESNGEDVRLLFKVGLLCTADSLWDRPSAREALAMINSMPSKIRATSEPDIVVSPIEELVREQPEFAENTQQRNADHLKVLAKNFDIEFSIDIYDQDELRKKYIHSSSCLSALYPGSRSVDRGREDLEVGDDFKIKN